MKPQKVGVLWGGGGFRCIAEVGWGKSLIPALVQYFSKFKDKTSKSRIYFGCTSGGAFNGPKIAEAQTLEEMPQKVEDLEKNYWGNVEKYGPECVFPSWVGFKLWNLFGKPSFSDGRTLWDLLESEKFGPRPFDPKLVVNSTIIDLDIFVTNATDAREDAISTRDARIKKNPSLLPAYIVASGSLTPLFPDVLIGNKFYSDGGHIQLYRALEAGCDTIFVLLPNREQGLDPRPSKFFPILLRTLEKHSISVRSRNNAEIANGLVLAGMIREQRQSRRKISSLFWSTSPKAKVNKILSHANFLIKNNLDLNVIPVFIEHQPESLSVLTFEKGDFAKLKDSSQTQMDRILSDINFGN